jgi:hypothetical protein
VMITRFWDRGKSASDRDDYMYIPYIEGTFLANVATNMAATGFKGRVRRRLKRPVILLAATDGVDWYGDIINRNLCTRSGVSSNRHNRRCRQYTLYKVFNAQLFEVVVSQVIRIESSNYHMKCECAPQIEPN